MKRSELIFALCSVCMLMLTACADSDRDGFNGDGTVNVRAVIGCRGGSAVRSSVYVDASSGNELINGWWIVMVNSSDGKIAKIIERESYKDYPVERESFEFSIPLGTYDAYAFANIAKSAVEALDGVGTLTEGEAMPDINDVVCDITNNIPNGTPENSVLIPMTGKKTVTYNSYNSYDTEFEVIRMVGKLKFIFHNSSSKNITLRYLKFSPLNEGNVLLMPDYSTLTYNNETDPVLLENGVTASDNLNVSLGPTVIPAMTDNCDTVCFYVRESLAKSNVTEHFQLTVGVKREGRENEILYALSGRDFTGINRNDYVVIPIRFTNYTVDIEPHFYPPIGGYPAEFTAKEEEFYCTFRTQGDFQIAAKVYDIFYETYLNSSRYTVTLENPPLTGDASIFDVAPHMDTATGEIIGRLGTAEGTACVYLKVSVDVGNGLFQEYYRRIYIIRENS